MLFLDNNCPSCLSGKFKCEMAIGDAEVLPPSKGELPQIDLLLALDDLK
jgi:hypothetical protein